MAQILTTVGSGWWNICNYYIILYFLYMLELFSKKIKFKGNESALTLAMYNTLHFWGFKLNNRRGKEWWWWPLSWFNDALKVCGTWFEIYSYSSLLCPYVIILSQKRHLGHLNANQKQKPNLFNVSNFSKNVMLPDILVVNYLSSM